jgi:hypothetical protein
LPAFPAKVGDICDWGEGRAPTARWDKSWNSDNTDTTKYVWTFPTIIVEATPTLSSDGGTVKIIIKDKV